MTGNIEKYYSKMFDHYRMTWGGNAIHIGIFKEPDTTIDKAIENSMIFLIELALKHINGGLINKEILDLGSGFGPLCRLLVEKYGVCVHGIDISEDNNNYHKKLNVKFGFDEKIRIFKGNFECMEFNNQSFDLIFSQDAIVHSFNKNKVFSEINRVLKPGGLLVFCDFTVTENCNREIINLLNIRSHGICNFVSKKDYIKLIKTNGMKLIDCHDFGKHLPIHYQKILENIDAEYFLKNQGAYTLIALKEGLKTWIKIGEEGILGWHFFVARKNN